MCMMTCRNKSICWKEGSEQTTLSSLKYCVKITENTMDETVNIISKNFNTKAEIFNLILAEICLEHSVTYCHMPSKINNPLKYESVLWTLKSFVTPHQPLKNDDHFIFKAGPHLDKCKLESWGLTHFATIFTLFWSKISESMILERIMYINFSRWVRKKLSVCHFTFKIFAKIPQQFLQQH